MKREIKDYENKDPRCTYPFDLGNPRLTEYCWGYALNIAENRTKEEIERWCNGCEFWEEK